MQELSHWIWGVLVMFLPCVCNSISQSRALPHSACDTSVFCWARLKDPLLVDACILLQKKAALDNSHLFPFCEYTSENSSAGIRGRTLFWMQMLSQIGTCPNLWRITPCRCWFFQSYQRVVEEFGMSRKWSCKQIRNACEINTIFFVSAILFTTSELQRKASSFARP